MIIYVSDWRCDTRSSAWQKSAGTLTVAVLADIHGNIIALEAVLKDLEHQENVDHIVVAGDLFAFGPAPNEVSEDFL
jgi:Icc-related predicted phosphoesterase